MRLGAPDYLELMKRLGRFGDNAVLPEQNTAVWTRYLELYAAHAGPLADLEIVATSSGLGFYRDPLMGDESWSWALTSPLSHPVLPFTAAEIVGAAAAIEALCAAEDIPPADLLSESFVAAEQDPMLERHFIWVNSPLAQFSHSFADYVTTLAPERRKQARRLYRQYDENSSIRFDFSARPPDSAEFDFIVQNTATRWGEEAPFALAQTLWPMAAAAILPCIRFCRVYDGDLLIFFNSYIIRDGVITSQATCRREGVVYNGLGVMIDFKVIELLTGSGLAHSLDPTCMTGLTDPGSILVAKREVININARKAVFAMRPERVREFAGGAPIPSFTEADGWQLPPDALVIGRGV